MIGIVGGGLTGLALGHELRAHGVAHTVLEAAPRPGGVIRSGRVEGHLLEWGPQRARLTAGLERLVRELGLSEQLVLAPAGLPLLVYSRGKLRRVPYSPAELARSDIFGWAAKMRLLLEPLTGAAKPGERVSDYFVRKVGKQAYENLLGPLYGGLYASDPADMVVDLSLGHVLREFGIRRSLLLPLLRRGGTISPPPACSFREGLQTLPEALAERNRGNVRLSTPVREIRGREGAYRLLLDDGEVPVEAVVLTTPGWVAADQLRHVAPEAARAIGSLRYNPLGVVHLHSDAALTGLGYQVAFGERLATRGVTFNHSLFDRHGVYTAYLGGARAPEVVDLSDSELGALAVREFTEVMGSDAEVLSVERERIPAWDASWAALRGLDLPPGVRIAANWESRPGMPGRLGQAARLAAELASAAG